MIAPIIHKSTGSSQDCRRGCAEWSNSLWRLSGPKHRVTTSCVYDGRCVYHHPRTRKMVPKENIIDNRQGQRQTPSNGSTAGSGQIRFWRLVTLHNDSRAGANQETQRGPCPLRSRTVIGASWLRIKVTGISVCSAATLNRYGRTSKPKWGRFVAQFV